MVNIFFTFTTLLLSMLLLLSLQRLYPNCPDLIKANHDLFQAKILNLHPTLISKGYLGY